jgi:hypothetical protein
MAVVVFLLTPANVLLVTPVHPISTVFPLNHLIRLSHSPIQYSYYPFVDPTCQGDPDSFRFTAFGVCRSGYKFTARGVC